MKVGDVVAINQVRGCWTPPKKEWLGHGIILSVTEQESFLMLGKYPYQPNDSAEVLLQCGATKTFDTSDLEVVV